MSLFTVEKPKLVSALERARNAVEKSINIPILENILIERSEDGEGLSVRATNLNIEVSCRFEARVDEAFSAFTLPAHRLFDIVKTWPDGREIQFAWADDARKSVVVKSGRSRFVLPVLPAQDFVWMRREPSAAAFTIDAGQLTAALSQCAYAVSREAVHFYLNGVLLQRGEEHLHLVSTDTHRMAVRNIDPGSAPPSFPPAIIPAATVAYITRYLVEGTVRLEVGANLINVGQDGLSVTSKLIEGSFPDWRRVIPENECHAVIDKVELAAAVARVALAADRGRASGVLLTFSQGLLAIEASGIDGRSGQDDVEAECDFDLEIGFNARYLTEALANLPGDTVHLFLKSNRDTMVIRGDAPSAPDDLFLLFPMRVTRGVGHV